MRWSIEPRLAVSGPRRASWRRFTIRTTLFIGFALILVLWLASGYDVTRRLSDVERSASAIDARYTRAEDQLLAIRMQVLLSSVYVRDALIDPDPGTLQEVGSQLRQAREAVLKGLEAYSPVVDAPTERETFARLRTELVEYWNALDEVMAAGIGISPVEARALIEGAVVPRYDVLAEITNAIQALNRSGYEQQQAELRQTYRTVQRSLWTRLGLVMLIGLATAWIVTWYASRLEAELRSQHLRDAQNTQDLQRLSAKLVNAQEEERRTIARELHDEIGQALTAIKMELGAVQRAPDLGAEASAALQGARGIADRTLHAVRDLSQILHPAMLDDLGLPSTVDWYVRHFSIRSGLRTELLQDGMQERLASTIETSAYRIIQEALTNVARHAEATRCRVYLQRLPHTILITVEDDGRGFDRRSEARGLGLLGIQERVTELRGTLRVESLPGKGTRLTVELPALARTAGPTDDDDRAVTEAERARVESAKA